MVDSLGLAANRISSFYKTSSSSLASSLKHISAGKRLLAPSEGVGDYMRIQQLRQDRNGYENLRRGLARGDAMMDVAQTAATNIVNDIKRMKEITEVYYGGTATTESRAALQAEFSKLVDDINQIRDTTYFEDRQLMQASSAVLKLNLSPNDLNRQMIIQFDATDIVDTTSLDVNAGEAAANQALDEQLGVAYKYLAKVSGFTRGLESQRAVMSSIISNTSAYESTINSIEDGVEMANAITQEIRNQASLSMLTQANMARQSILKLFG